MTQRRINVSLTAKFFNDIGIRIVAHLKFIMDLPAKYLAQYAHLGLHILKIMKLNTAVDLQHHLHWCLSYWAKRNATQNIYGKKNKIHEI